MRKSTALIRLAGALLLSAAVYQVPAVQSAECIEGRVKQVIIGPYCSCENGTKTPKEKYQCINGQWEYQYTFCGGPFCQGDPGGGGGGCNSETVGSCPYEPGTYICPAYCYCCY